jgi:hypothetical protein
MLNPLLSALDAWVAATSQYSEHSPPPDHAGVLAAATCALMHKLCPFLGMPAWRVRATVIATNLLALTGRFIDERYGDDDTDGPCDVEWDVHSLVRAIEPIHVIPGEVVPAHVVGTAFPHPSDEI